MITREDDGCFHPQTEEELAELVAHAHAMRWHLRVLGSSHSVWAAIVTDRFAGQQTPHDEIQVVLDRYIKVFDSVPDPAHPGMMLTEVQAGCHLGASPLRLVQGRIAPGAARNSDVLSPSHWHDEGWDKSFNKQIHDRGLALSDLGGITHQTVSGFLATGSQGGTVKWSVHSAIARMRVIDGEGRVHELSPDTGDTDWFRAAGIAMGMCGVVSTLTFRCEPRFDISGSETISATSQCDVLDFYGNRQGLPSLETFLLETDYSRLMWWPQRNFDRLVVWQAQRKPYNAHLAIKPYKEIAALPVLSQIAASVIYTVLGNIDTPERILPALKSIRATLDANTLKGSVFELGSAQEIPELPQHLVQWVLGLVARAQRDPITMAAAWVPLVQLLVVGTDEIIAALLGLPLVKQLFALLGRLVPSTIGDLLGLFVTSGTDGAPATQHFADRWYMGLPMDNQMDDLLMPTWFTELWVPFTPGDGTIGNVISTLRTLFDADGTAEGAYAATGAFSFELYVGKADPHFYMSPATGERPVFRVDVFWFARNAGDPCTDFYPQFWKALAPFGFRAHWGKFLPTDPAQRAAMLAQYPHLDTWKRVRRRIDPHDVFLTRYWKEQLEI